jgi:uncharacterized protein (DUF1800 family)
VADPSDIAHLLRRTEFVARPTRVTALSAMTLAQAVDDVLDIGRNGAPQPPAALLVHDKDRGWEQFVEATHWWLASMLTRPRPFQEKMTLFWHGHFTSSWESVGKTDHMMSQNQLYRSMALGNYRQLAQRMSLEPAMLIYLSNGFNKKGEPNENFGRELLELFLLGAGNYTEADVHSCARAWTGHNYDWDTRRYVFRSHHHDTGTKTFLGTTRNWDGPEIIDFVLRDHPTARVTAARHIARKLWEYLAHPGPPAGVVEALGDVLLANSMELRPMIRALLLRPEFYAPAAKQGLVRPPADWMVALAFHTGIPIDQMGATWNGGRMGQVLFHPPNVSGWRPNAAWLNTSAVSGRAGLARHLTWKLRDKGGYDFLNDLSVEAAVDHVAGAFGIAPLSASTRNALIAAHRAERSATRWKNWWAPTNLLTMTMLAPELHMA